MDRTLMDVDEILLRAKLRRERRLAAVMRAQGAFPTPETWRTLDLVHEATHLIDRLERIRGAMEDHRIAALYRERYPEEAWA